MAVGSTDGSSRSQGGQFLVGRPLGSPRTRDWRTFVGPPARPGAALPAAHKYAAFVVHGVGQQTEFTTLDAMAQGIARVAGAAISGPPVARQVAVGEERLRRIELTLETDGGTRELHVYEGYWAPLTEGAVTLRDVIYLVFRAIATGLRIGTGHFRRWLHGRSDQFPPQIRTVAYLLIGLAAVLSLIVINTAIMMVVGTRWALGLRETIIGDGLYGDLSTAFNALFVSLVIFAIVLTAHRWLGRVGAPAFAKTLAGVVSVLSFLLALGVTTGVGLAILLLFYLHRVAGPDHKLPLLPSAFGLQQVDWFNDRVEMYVLAFAVALLLSSVAFFGVRILLAWLRGRGDRGSAQPFGGIALLVMLAGTLGLVVEALWLGLTDWGFGVHRSTAIERGAVWTLLVAGSLWVRRIVVQYVGDVVAYVQPHTLDRFDELRSKIKDTVYRRARAIYSLRSADGHLEYSDVAVVGHSLGSVVAYDTLNRLINEDAVIEDVAASPRLRIVDRTCLFLTLGSPLDKTAYLFGAQQATPGRFALAATAQPLIQRFDDRPARWVNVSSIWDPISGTLEYYDPSGKEFRKRHGKQDPREVDDRRDPAATTLFLAHVEYWDGTLIYQTLLDALPWGVTHARRATDETSCPHPGLPVAQGTGLEES